MKAYKLLWKLLKSYHNEENVKVLVLYIFLERIKNELVRKDADPSSSGRFKGGVCGEIIHEVYSSANLIGFASRLCGTEMTDRDLIPKMREFDQQWCHFSGNVAYPVPSRPDLSLREYGYKNASRNSADLAMKKYDNCSQFGYKVMWSRTKDYGLLRRVYLKDATDYFRKLVEEI